MSPPVHSSILVQPLLRDCREGAHSFAPPSLTDARLEECRESCGACCIAPSITTPIPGMPFGKPAGIPCVQLLPDYRCALFGCSERPKVCVSLRPSLEMCGHSRHDAMEHLQWLEVITQPSAASLP